MNTIAAACRQLITIIRVEYIFQTFQVNRNRHAIDAKSQEVEREAFVVALALILRLFQRLWAQEPQT